MPMIKNTNNLSLTLSLNILKALGGDTSVQYDTVDDVWNAINDIYDRAGDKIDISAIILDITENGQYNFDPNEDVDAFAPVHLNVNVPQKYTDEQVANLQITARQEGYQDGEANQKAKLIDIEITDNGVYETDDGYKKVTVAVEQGIPDDELQQMLQEAMDEGYQDGYAEGVDDGYEDGATEQKAKLTSVTFNENGTYTREDGWNHVTIAVEGGSVGKPKVYNGFRFTTGYPLQVDFSQYDWSDVYDLSYMFAGCRRDNSENWTNFQNNFNGKILSLERAFKKEGSYCMSSLPSLGSKTANCYTMKSMCDGNNNLTSVNISSWDTSNVVNMGSMFYNCSKLTYISLFDTSNVVNMGGMFQGCSSLTSVPFYDTSNVVNMGSMFASCDKLTSVPFYDTSNVVNMGSMFLGCRSLTSVPQFDMSCVTTAESMFYNCSSLTVLPDINCKSLTSFGGSNSWIRFCSNLTTIGVIDCDSITNIRYIFGTDENKVLTDIGGLRNLGKQISIDGLNTTAFLQMVPNLTHQSLLNIFNELYDRASAGLSVLTIKMHPNHLTLLSDDDIAIATNKGWILS